MAEPSTVSGAVATTLVSGAALSQILPLIDANAAFGAVMGMGLRRDDPRCAQGEGEGHSESGEGSCSLHGSLLWLLC